MGFSTRSWNTSSFPLTFTRIWKHGSNKLWMPQCLISGWMIAETWWQWGGGKVCFPALFLQWWGFLHHNYGTYFASIGLKLPMKWSLLLALTEVSCCSIKWTTIKWLPFTMLKLSTCIHVSFYNNYTILSILINLPIKILT